MIRRSRNIRQRKSREKCTTSRFKHGSNDSRIHEQLKRHFMKAWLKSPLPLSPPPFNNHRWSNIEVNWEGKIVSASVYFLAFGGLRDSKNPEFRIPPRAKQPKTVLNVKLLPSSTSAPAIKVKLRHYNPARVKRGSRTEHGVGVIMGFTWGVNSNVTDQTKLDGFKHKGTNRPTQPPSLSWVH